MEPQLSLFARARPGYTTSKKATGFLGLPGELRNEIYGYHFQDNVRVELAAKGFKFADEQTTRSEALSVLRVSRRLGRYMRIHGLQTHWLTSPGALILACKVVYCEAIAYLYRQTTFAFNAPKRIRNFLNVTPGQNLTHITRLQLHIETYQNPRSGADEVWKRVHTHSWMRACWAAAKSMVNLQDLRIHIMVHNRPLKFYLREPWVRPLLQFRPLFSQHTSRKDSASAQNRNTGSRRTKRVEVTLASFWTTQKDTINSGPIHDAAVDLHRLFSRAIARAILGASETAAMTEILQAWNGPFQ